MNIEKFYKLKELVELRKKLAYAHLQNAHKKVLDYKSDVAEARKNFLELEIEGKEKITKFLSGDYSVNNNYPSRLSALRSLTAIVDYEIQKAQSSIERAELNLYEAERQVFQKQKEYENACKKVKKIEHLSEQVSRQVIHHQGSIQEIDRLEGSVKSDLNSVVG